ncbi:MAG TPA: class I SAM-dependent methyltransferase [Spirochaetota bacterium]|nr:class I SAM-dependent methyltransferase [Spirochaetota bacterium]
MGSIEVFDKYYIEYEKWFEENKNIYLSELNLLKSLIPDGLNGIEIGVGTGRFAEPLNIKIGVEPSDNMEMIAENRGIMVIKGSAEKLTFDENSFDFALMVTTICFVDDPVKALKEAYRIIKPSGFIVIAFVPSDSFIGEFYIQKKDKSRFYKDAKFYTVKEVEDFLKISGFKNLFYRQTLFENTNDYVQPYKDGYGEGGFVAVRAEK